MTEPRFYFTDRVKPILQVGIGSTVIGDGAAVWDVSLWDAPTSLWNGDEPLWRDVSCEAITARIEAGRERIMDSFPVGRADVLVQNITGWADPSLTFEVDSEPGYIDFDGGLGELTVPDAAALDLTGDFTMILRVWVDEAPASVANFVRKGDPNDLAYRIGMFASTDFFADVSADGTVLGAASYQTPSLPRAIGVWRWVAFAFDANNGAGDNAGTWWYGGNDFDPTAWQLIETATWPGAMAIHNSTDALRIGKQLNGRLSHVEIRSGHGGLSGGHVQVGGTAVFKIDGWQLMDFDAGAATLRAATGQTVTVSSSGSSTPTVVPAVNPAGSPLLELRPGRPIRVGVDHDTLGKCWRFNGFIDEIVPTDEPENWAEVRMLCIDALGEAGRAKLVSDVETGADEVAWARFGRILNAITWPTTKRSLSPSAIRPLYAAELNGQVVDLLRQTAESEGGWAFGDNNGDVVLQHRDWLYHVVNSEVDGIIGNPTTTPTATELLTEGGDILLTESGDTLLVEDSDSDVCPTRWVRSFARRNISTVVILDREFPTTVTPESPVRIVDVPARTLYGEEPYERLDLWTRDRATVIQNAGRILSTRSAALSMPTIAGADIDAATSDAAVDLLSTLSIFTPSRYRCILVNERGTVFDAKFFAVGITEEISAEAWTASISLDRARPFEVLDPGDYIWDTARWDHSLWN